MPVMAYLACDDPHQLTRAQFVRLGLVTGPGGEDDLPYSAATLQDFEREYCNDSFWGRSGGHARADTRIIVTDAALIFVGSHSDRFFSGPETGLLSQFRGQFLGLFLIAHFHKAALLSMSDELAVAMNRLTVGVPGGSSGIAIAQRLGLTQRIIERARELMAPESLEAADLIAYLHRTRDELDRLQAQMTQERHTLEEERKKLRTEWLGRQQKRIAELEAQFAEMQRRFEQNVASVVEAVKDRELRAQLEKTSRRKLQEVRSGAKEDLNAAIVQTISESQSDLGVTQSEFQPIAAETLQAGARIHVRGFTKPLIFRRIDGNSAEVEAGPLRMKVALDEITGIEQPAASKLRVTPSVSVVRSAPREMAAPSEINVIGMTVEQATELVDKFLDDAALAQVPQVRIIHGHGTGALRKGLAEYLKTQPLVAKASFESEEHGGKAITVVELRN